MTFEVESKKNFFKKLEYNVLTRDEKTSNCPNWPTDVVAAKKQENRKNESNGQSAGRDKHLKIFTRRKKKEVK